jgi:hypothetical protein
MTENRLQISADRKQKTFSWFQVRSVVVFNRLDLFGVPIVYITDLIE